MARSRACEWSQLDDEQLLGLRFRDLGLCWEDSPLAPAIARVTGELARRGLLLRPHWWLSTEWFTPDGVPGVALPFYLAHPRLLALEKRMVHRAEGAAPAEALRILRHEVGHAVMNAYALRGDEQAQALFGPSARRYPTAYTPRLHSRRFVRHLAHGYAQSHPDEDFAETFAVWLTPGSCWRERYAGWPALRKLEWMDRTMRQLAGRPPVLRNRRRVEPLESLSMTLGRHYAKRRRHLGLEGDLVLDRRLRALFVAAGAARRPSMTAERFLRKIRKELTLELAERSGRPRYAVGQSLERVIRRTRELDLRVPRSLAVRSTADALRGLAYPVAM